MMRLKFNQKGRSRLAVLFLTFGIIFVLIVFIVRANKNNTLQSSPNSNSLSASSSKVHVKLLGEMIIRDWSPNGKRLLGDKKDSSGVSQIYTWATDGSDEQIISGLPEKCHKGFAHYHPSGRYIVATVEMNFSCPKKYAEPGAAANSNLWVYDFTNQKWTNITQYSFPKNTSDVKGALSPYFSHNGKKVIWSRITQPANFIDKRKIFGKWDTYIADFSTVGGPRLENVRKLDLGNGNLYETHGFSPDDTKIIFSSEINTDYSAGLDVWMYDLQTKQLTNLTQSPNFYDEHARFSPDGKKIVWGSSSCCKKYNKQRFLGTLQSEAFIMNMDRSNLPVQLTHFNTPGYPEYSNKRTGNWPTSWSPDGKRFITAQQFYDNTPARSYLITILN